MTDPDYLTLTIVLLGPFLYFVLIGLLLPPHRPDWNAAALGLVPGIGLVACVSDLRGHIDRLSAARQARQMQRAAAARPSGRPAPGDRQPPGAERSPEGSRMARLSE